MSTHSTATSTDLATSAANLATSDANNATRPGRPIQLCRWIRELAGWMECAQEGVVLQGSWKGLPRSTGRWVCPRGHHLCAIRLQRWLRKLDGGVECSKERMVLPQCRKGLPSSCRRVCLS